MFACRPQPRERLRIFLERILNFRDADFRREGLRPQRLADSQNAVPDLAERIRDFRSGRVSGAQHFFVTRERGNAVFDGARYRAELLEMLEVAQFGKRHDVYSRPVYSGGYGTRKPWTPQCTRPWHEARGRSV